MLRPKQYFLNEQSEFGNTGLVVKYLNAKSISLVMRRDKGFVLIIFLVFLVSCSSPTRVEITGTPVVETGQTLQNTDGEGFLMLTLNPTIDVNLIIRNVEVYDGLKWTKLSDGLIKNGEKTVLLGQKKLPVNVYRAVRFTFDSAKIKDKDTTMPYPHAVIPIDFTLSEDFTILSFELLPGESIKISKDQLIFAPFFRIEVQNALLAEVKTDKTVELFDQKLVKTVKIGMSEEGDFLPEKSVEALLNEKKENKLTEDPRGLQLNYSKYMKSELLDGSLPKFSIDVYEKHMNPVKVLLKKNESVNLLFNSKYNKILGLSIPGLNYNFLLNEGENFSIKINPQSAGTFDVRCIDPCWGREGSNLGVLVVEEVRERIKYKR